MKAIKYASQILAAFVYTVLFCILMYAILVLPTIWLVTLNTKIMILFCTILGGLVQFIIFGLQFVLLYPYKWIVKDNRVAMWISIIIAVAYFIRASVLLWGGMIGIGGSAIVLAIIITGLIIEAVYVTVAGIVSLKE